MKNNENKILCETPAQGSKPCFIDKWKYDLICNAIVEILSDNREGVYFKNLPDLIKDKLTSGDKKKLGSIMWYTTTVKLDMEVKGMIIRIPKISPQKLILNADEK